MMADPTVTYAGWAFKEGSLVKNWKKRFLVVKRRELAYYKTTDHTSRHAQLLGAMRVARVEKAASITNGLIISSMEGRQLKIFMDTAAERDRCYAALIEWCHPAGSTNEPPPNVRVHGVASTAQPSTVAATAAAARGRMAGWLEKQGQNMPTWKRRYFVLDEGILTYSQHEGGSSLARHRVLGVRRDRTKPFTLALTLDTGRELRVSASSEHDLNDWSRALHATIQTSPSRPPSGHGGYEERSSGIDQRGQLDDSQASYNNLFGAPPAAVEDANEDDDAGRRSTNMSFGHNIRLDFDGENTSFIECAPPQPAAKPWSPKAPGVDTIRRMRIEQNLLVDSDDDDDEFVITRVVSSTQASSSASGSSSPVPSRRPNAPDYKKKKKQETVGPGPCCCVVM